MGKIKSLRGQSIHHKRCRSNGGGSTPNNLVMVTVIKHRAWHTLFDNMLPHQIAEEINRVWLDPRFKFECVPKKPVER